MKIFAILLSALIALPTPLIADAIQSDYTDKTTAKDCNPPHNPYNNGGGHDAGFNWAIENSGGCNGNSNSFNEGCEDYYRQLNEYKECIANNRK
jgi:hypothetical protein